jgi:hypothetical protein
MLATRTMLMEDRWADMAEKEVSYFETLSKTN